MARTKSTTTSPLFTAAIARQVALETGKNQVAKLLSKIEKAARNGDLNVTVEASLVSPVVRETLQNAPYSYKVAGIQRNGHKDGWNQPAVKETVLIQW